MRLCRLIQQLALREVATIVFTEGATLPLTIDARRVVEGLQKCFADGRWLVDPATGTTVDPSKVAYVLPGERQNLT